MYIKASRGVTLVELMVFIVIVGIAMAGMFAAFDTITRGSADPQVRKQVLAIAESLMDEIALLPFTYCDPDDPAAVTATGTGDCATAEGIGTEGGETRYSTTARFDNVSDFHGFTMGPGHPGHHQHPGRGTGRLLGDDRDDQASARQPAWAGSRTQRGAAHQHHGDRAGWRLDDTRGLPHSLRADYAATMNRRYVSRFPGRSGGVTLIELAIVIALVGIVGALIVNFVQPVRSYIDSSRRAALADTADTALRRIGRDVRLALPNSVRVTDALGVTYRRVPAGAHGRALPLRDRFHGRCLPRRSRERRACIRLGR